MANSEGSDHMLNRVMPKDNIGLAALLKTKEAAWDNGKHFRHFNDPPLKMFKTLEKDGYTKKEPIFFPLRAMDETNTVESAVVRMKRTKIPTTSVREKLKLRCCIVGPKGGAQIGRGRPVTSACFLCRPCCVIVVFNLYFRSDPGGFDLTRYRIGKENIST